MYPLRRSYSLTSKAKRFFHASVCEDHLLEAELLVLAFATGINDASTYSEYRVFTANHTGNTIMLAVGVTEIATNNTRSIYPVHLSLIAISLLMFLVGAWIPGQLGHIFGCQRRWWLIANNFFQTVLVFTSSMLQARDGGWYFGPLRDTAEGAVDPYITLRNNSEVLGPWVVALLAFSGGGQVCMSRSINIPEITTANATSTYVDILIDSQLFALHNKRRNRRILFIISLTAGSFAGGFLYQHMGSGRTLLVSAAGKLLVTLCMFLNEGEPSADDASKSEPNSEGRRCVQEY
jgi:uncharacterized membrane protein YoaK (UPF0700 family)